MLNKIKPIATTVGQHVLFSSELKLNKSRTRKYLPAIGLMWRNYLGALETKSAKPSNTSQVSRCFRSSTF